MRHATLRIVFGLSFGELCVLLLVSVVVLGPKELPKYLRKAGQLAGRLRRLAFEMREKSGIDEILRTEGIDRDIAEIRSLARGEVGGIAAAVRSTADAARFGIGPQGQQPATAGAVARPPAPAPVPQGGPAPTLGNALPLGNALANAHGNAPGNALPLAATASPTVAAHPALFTTQREYPPEGADSYGALPDTAFVYDGSYPASALAEDPLYARGEDPTAAPGEVPLDEPPARAATGTAG
jgi:sec-independent protein translocase protein TatB